MSQHEHLQVITDPDTRFITFYSGGKQVIKKRDFHYRLRHNGFVFESAMIGTQNYKHVLFHIGCMTKAPYTRIAFLTVSRASDVNEHTLFKDSMPYRDRVTESFRFAYSIDRDAASVASVKSFIEDFDADNLSYVDAISESLITDVISKSFTRFSSVNVEEIKYMDENYNEAGDNLSLSFAQKLITSKDMVFVPDELDDEPRERNEFVFVSKKLSFEAGAIKHVVILKVGRSKRTPEETQVIFDVRHTPNNGLDKSIFYCAKINDREYDGVTYDDNEHNIAYSELSQSIKDEVALLVNIIGYEQAMRIPVYAISRTTRASHYESPSTSYDSMMGFGFDKQALIDRYNKSVAVSAPSRAIKNGENSVSYSGSTGGGCSSVSHRVTVSEFREFDMPRLEVN